MTGRAVFGWGMGLPRDWGSGCGGDFGERVVRGEEALPEAGAERAVVDGAADLEQPIGTAPRPAHLLRFVHATIDEEVGRSLGQRRANPQPGPVSFAVVDQGTVARLGVMPRWLLADADRWRFGRGPSRDWGCDGGRVFPRSFSDRGWMRGLGFEAGGNRSGRRGVVRRRRGD